MIVQRSDTTFVAVPPRIVPMFAVVSASMRPSGMRAIARAAASMALRPASGTMPACAVRPTNVASSLRSDGAEATMPPTSPEWSKTKP